MHHRILLCAALVAILSPVCNAQANGQPEVTLQFLAFPPAETPKPIDLEVDKNKTIPIEIPNNDFSPTYKVNALDSIIVGITTDNAKQEKVFQVLGKAPALGSARQIILLMRKGADNEDGFDVIPTDGNLQKFPGGSYYFINTAKISVSGLIGDKEFTLKAGEKEIVQPGSTHSGGGCQVTLSYSREEKWKTFYDTRWTVNPRLRTLVIFYENPESGGLCVAPIVQIL